MEIRRIVADTSKSGRRRGVDRSRMTPRVAAKLTIHDPAVAVAEAAVAQPVVASPSRRLALVGRDERAVPQHRRREALRRRLLCAADVVAAAAALVLVVTVVADDRLKWVALAGTPAVVLLFKVAGLYDREQLRLLRSTLDEAPAARPARRPVRADCRHPAAVRGRRASGGRRARCAVADQLLRDHGGAHVGALARSARGWERALPGHRRRRAGVADPRQAVQQPRARRRRRHAAAGRPRSGSPRGPGGRAAPGRRTARRPDHHRARERPAGRRHRARPAGQVRRRAASACCRGCSRSSVRPSSSRTSTA